MTRVDPPPPKTDCVDVYFSWDPRDRNRPQLKRPLRWTILRHGSADRAVLWVVRDAAGYRVADGFCLPEDVYEVRQFMMDLCEAGVP